MCSVAFKTSNVNMGRQNAKLTENMTSLWHDPDDLFQSNAA